MTPPRTRPAETMAAAFGVPAGVVTAFAAHDWLGAGLLWGAAVLPGIVTGIRTYGLAGLWNRLLHGDPRG